jgi:hypothetical protein
VVPNRFREQSDELIDDRDGAFEIAHPLELRGDFLQLTHAASAVACLEESLGMRALYFPARRMVSLRLDRNNRLELL